MHTTDPSYHHNCPKKTFSHQACSLLSAREEDAQESPFVTRQDIPVLIQFFSLLWPYGSSDLGYWLFGKPPWLNQCFFYQMQWKLLWNKDGMECSIPNKWNVSVISHQADIWLKPAASLSSKRYQPSHTGTKLCTVMLQGLRIRKLYLKRTCLQQILDHFTSCEYFLAIVLEMVWKPICMVWKPKPDMRDYALRSHNHQVRWSTDSCQYFPTWKSFPFEGIIKLKTGVESLEQLFSMSCITGGTWGGVQG